MDLREFTFGGFVLRPRQRELLRDGRQLRVEKIPFDLLVMLVERAGDLVRREEITKQLWGPDMLQDLDASLNTAVRKLRTALRDQSDNSRFIQTVVGQGYRFIAPVEAVEHKDEAVRRPRPRRMVLALFWISAFPALLAAWVAFQYWPRTPDAAMVAVLPFEELGENSPGNYFSQGITEEITTQLGRVASSAFGVIAGPSSWRYRGQHPPAQQLLRELGAGYVLTGTVRRQRSDMRITARLVRTRDEVQIWSDAFNGDAGEVLMLQQRVALAVAGAVAAQFKRRLSSRTAHPANVDAAAYELYLQGRFYWNQRNERSLKLALDYFHQALARAPDYAGAWSAMADSYAALVYGCYMSPAEGFAQARAAVEHGRSLDPGSAELLASEGYLNMYFDWDFDAAQRELELAIAANANYAPAHNWMGVLMTAEQKPAEARAALDRAIHLDPGSLPIATDLGFHLHYSGRNKEAEEILRTVLARDPNFGLAHFWMGRVLNREGDCSGALRELSSLPPAASEWQPLIAARGYAAGVCGQPEQARAELARFERMSKSMFVTSYGVALIEAGLGDKDAALMWLRKALEERSHWLVWARLDPRFDSLRGDARFEAIAGKVFSRR